MGRGGGEDGDAVTGGDEGVEGGGVMGEVAVEGHLDVAFQLRGEGLQYAWGVLGGAEGEKAVGGMEAVSSDLMGKGFDIRDIQR